MNSVNEIRAKFLHYFEKKDHQLVPSSSLIPHNDPTLMFTNAGMVQFKNYFTGMAKSPYSRAVTSQKCVRAGGKHNDLDNVGYTARHHTFFEMLGNFSFGDYFKEEAIKFSWDLLTKDFSLPKEKLLVTVYHEDDEAALLWKKISGLPEDKIIRIATNDNFWSMGDTGPCGPCSEIFYDHGEKVWGGPPGSAEEDGDRFIEIWNLVFMQYEQLGDGRKINLPKPSIDTGMGLERIAAVLQGVHDNYDIDLFRKLIEASVAFTNVEAVGEFAASHRVIADHLRSSAFLIADGVLPSNEGRGYVLRRIMRRAMRHAQLLKAKDPLLCRLLPTLVGEMGQAYPELVRAEALILQTLELEEKRFQKTLGKGLTLLNEAIDGLGEGEKLDGEVAFKLYDTYGFPLDLTQDALRRKQIDVDIDGFEKAMARQREEARAHWVGSGEIADQGFWFDIKEKVTATEFVGYTQASCEAIIVALIKDGEIVEEAKEGEKVSILVNQTSFYAESGGQVSDKGIIKKGDAFFRVENVQKKAETLFVHTGIIEKSVLRTGDQVFLEIDRIARKKSCANHSATHILHEALREILGEHVAQKGSLVTPDRLRFDFSHGQPLSQQEVFSIEEVANNIILQNTPITTRLMAVDDAIAMGARALFGQKYGEEVRVVSMGYKDCEESNDKNLSAWSIELCGGTHASRTGDIGLIAIVSESAVSSGVRRIEALTGQLARHYLTQQARRAQEVAGLLKTTVSDLCVRATDLLEERKNFEREIVQLKKDIALNGSKSSEHKKDIEKINDVAFLYRIIQGIQAKDLKSLVDGAKRQLRSGIAVFITIDEKEKASVVVGVTEDLSLQYSAIDLVRIAVENLGGKGGGGRSDLAQGGGPDGASAQKAIDAIRNYIAK